MDDIGGLLAAQGDGANKIRTLRGTFVGLINGEALVDVGGGRIPANTIGSPLPQVNETCHVWFLNSVPFLMGPTKVRPGVATITAVDGDYVVLDSGDRMPFYAGYTPAVDDIVKIDWNQLPAVAWVLSTQPEPVEPPPPPVTPGSEQVQVFTAVDSGSWNGRWTQSQVWASDTYLGFWWYGSKIAGTIPASAPILSVEVFMSVARKSGSAPNFVTHAYGSKPGGTPGFNSANEPVTVTPGWVPLPTSFGDRLKAGGGSLGIGVNHGGWNIFNSLGADPQSGALRIRYRN